MGKSLTPLTGLDAAFLYLESAGTPMHVGSVMLIELPAKRNYDFHQALLALVAERLPRAPALRRILHEAPLGLGHPMWADAPQLDLGKHIRRRKLPGKGGQAKLMSLVGKLHSEPLSRDLPMWQFVVIENVEPGVVALYSKIHHALLDGQGGIALAQALLDVVPNAPKGDKTPASNAAASKDPRKRDLASSATRSTVKQFANLLRALPATLKLAGSVSQAAGMIGNLRDNVLLAPRTVFNRQIGPDRSFGAISLPIDEIKRVARGFGVSLNDVVMAVCSGALRELLLTVDALPKKSLVAAMPVSLREAGNKDVNNQVSMVQCSLATDVADPVARLRAIHDSTAQIKRRVHAFKNLIPTDFPGLAAPIWAAGLSRLWGSAHISERLPALANVAISNVPGPPVPLFLAGAKLQHYYPVSIVTHGLGLNITVQSYAGNLEFGLTACKDIVARPDIVARAMATALTELAERLP
jgi:diacylglycerol O-acyltransferase / wax synthase